MAQETLIRAVYRDRRALQAALLPNLPHGGVFVATRYPLELMDPVTVDLRIPEIEHGLMVRGVVASRRVDRGRRALRPGLGIHFLSSEQRKREFLEGVISGDVVDLMRRRHRRIPVRVQVQWTSAASPMRCTSLVDDISEGGAFIRTRKFQRPGSVVVLEMSGLGREAAITLQAVVSWTCHTAGEEGMGVRFVGDERTAIEVRELISLLLQRTYGEALTGS